MQLISRPGSLSRQVCSSLIEHRYDLGLVLDEDRVQVFSVLCRACCGQGVDLVRLATAASAEFSDPRREESRNIDHVLTGSDEELCQVPPQAVGALDRPRAIRQTLSPCEKFLIVTSGCFDAQTFWTLVRVVSGIRCK